jgi:hypothetical protein
MVALGKEKCIDLQCLLRNSPEKRPLRNVGLSWCPCVFPPVVVVKFREIWNERHDTCGNPPLYRVVFEVLTAVSTKMAVFWVVARCYRPDDGGSKDLWNIGKLIPDYTAIQPLRQPSSTFIPFSFLSSVIHACEILRWERRYYTSIRYWRVAW